MKGLKISLTIVVELAIIYLFSKMVGWSFMESFFLGSLAIFAITEFMMRESPRRTLVRL